MKPKKTVAMLVILLGLLGVFALGSSAEAGSYFCTVNQTGMGWGTYYINLTHTGGSPAFTDRWFIMPPTHYKELLAVALTAMTNDMLVFVNVEPTEYSVINTMYLFK